MKRVIVKRYDETNSRWTANYYCVYDDLMIMIRYQQPVMSGYYSRHNYSRVGEPMYIGLRWLDQAEWVADDRTQAGIYYSNVDAY